MRQPIIIESPCAGDVEGNLAYLNRCIRHCIYEMNETPYASHLMLTGALNDLDPTEREDGILAGFDMADGLIETGAYRVFYVDRGISSGMRRALEVELSAGRVVTLRSVTRKPFYAQIKTLEMGAIEQFMRDIGLL